MSSHEYEGNTQSAPAQIEQPPGSAELEKTQPQARPSQATKSLKSSRLAPAPVPAVSPWKSAVAAAATHAPPVDAALAQAQVQQKKQTTGKGKGPEVAPAPKRTTGKEKWVRYTPPPAPAGSTATSSRDSPGAPGERRSTGGKQRSRKQGGGGQSGQRSQNGGGQRKSKSNYNSSSATPPPQQRPPASSGPATNTSGPGTKSGTPVGNTAASSVPNASVPKSATAATGLPTAPLMPTNPLELTLGLLAQQMEYYFSLENLCKDIFLRRQMNSNGLVPLAVLANFNRVRAMSGGDLSLVVEACRWAPGVQTIGKKVRPLQNWEQWVLPLEDRLDAGKDESNGDDDEPKFEVENAKPFVPRQSRS